MIINKETIKEFLEGVLDGCHDDFDELETDCEFEFDDGYVRTCESVSTSRFRVTVNDFEVEINGGQLVYISGSANASYSINGSCYDGDWDDAGRYIECASSDGIADFSFTIWPDGDELSEDVGISIA